MSHRSITIQLPEALLAEIDTQAELTRSSRTETIVKILQQAVENRLGDRTSLHTILFRIEVLEQKLGDLVDRCDSQLLEQLEVRLSALEEERMTTPTIAHSLETHNRSQSTACSESQNSHKAEWMTIKEAFTWLGGDPQDPSSGVTSLDGRRSVGFNRFRVLKASDYQVFGLAFQSDRRRKQLPCLRPIP
jgi:hypothetical protein